MGEQLIGRGDKAVIQRYVGFAKAQMRALKQRMESAGLKTLYNPIISMPDGTTIRTWSCFGQDTIIIEAGGQVAEEQEWVTSLYAVDGTHVYYLDAVHHGSTIWSVESSATLVTASPYGVFSGWSVESGGVNSWTIEKRKRRDGSLITSASGSGTLNALIAFKGQVYAGGGLDDGTYWIAAFDRDLGALGSYSKGRSITDEISVSRALKMAITGI